MSKPVTPHAAHPLGGHCIATDSVGLPAIMIGATVPTDGTAGYSVGCKFIHNDGSGESDVEYTNVGTATSCDFNPTTSGLTATSAEVNRVADASSRIIVTTATSLSLTVTEHAERVVLIETNSTVANTFTLPAAAGTGAKFTIVNNLVQTQGTVVIAALGTDVMNGACIGVTNSVPTADGFFTSASSDKVSLNLTTTGGLGGDTVEAWDKAAGVWFVKVLIHGSGTIATPFSQT